MTGRLCRTTRRARVAQRFSRRGVRGRQEPHLQQSARALRRYGRSSRAAITACGIACGPAPTTPRSSPNPSKASGVRPRQRSATSRSGSSSASSSPAMPRSIAFPSSCTSAAAHLQPVPLPYPAAGPDPEHQLQKHCSEIRHGVSRRRHHRFALNAMLADQRILVTGTRIGTSWLTAPRRAA